MTAPPTPSSADRIPAPTPTSIVTSTVATSDMSTGPTLREHPAGRTCSPHAPTATATYKFGGARPT